MTRWRRSGTPARPAMILFWSFRSVMRAFVDAGVVPGGDALHDGVLVLAQGFDQADHGREARCGELLEPVGQRGCVSGVEHGGELTHQVMGAVQFWTVRE
jgi:hypothetical protein